MSSQYTLENEVFAGLVFYGSLALIKTVMMSMLTAYFRIRNESVPTLEDAKMMAPNDPDKQKVLLQPNQDVERVRRAHLNDLENVIPFVLLGLLFVGTNPDPTTALWHFRIFLAARVLHSIAYVNALRQPLRGIGFGIGLFAFCSMAFQTVHALC
ncbi:unnamed protein product [Clavelina lepadiformis]|uniref:Microsomal glutathione S-transferase 1 n=1 Tax=Clavelina lepadiformis TaxID=159417 RepID=A0ABP0GB39_CLALP